MTTTHSSAREIRFDETRFAETDADRAARPAPPVPAPQPTLPAADNAEARLARHIVKSLFITVPLLVAAWVGLIALAVSFTTTGYAAPLAMGAAVGVLAGVFWGTWLGFVLDSVDEEAARRTGRAAHQSADAARTGHS